jgi:hypothetical protein
MADFNNVVPGNGVGITQGQNPAATMRARMQQAAGASIPTLHQSISAEEVNTQRAAQAAQATLADTLLTNRAKEEELARAQQAQRDVATANQVVALQERQARDAELAARREELNAAYGSSRQQTIETGVKIASVAEAQQKVAEQIAAMDRVKFADNPMQWILNQFTVNGLIEQHNTLDATQTTMRNSMEKGVAEAAQADAAYRAQLDPLTQAGKLAELDAIKMQAAETAYKTATGLLNSSNMTQQAIASAQEARYTNAAQLGGAQRQVTAQNHASLVDKLKWDSGQNERLWRDAQISGSKYSELAYASAEQNMGLAPGTFASLLKTVSQKEQDALAQFAYSNTINPANAEVIARYADKERASKPLVELAKAMNQGKQQLDAELTQGGVLWRGQKIKQADFEALPPAERATVQQTYSQRAVTATLAQQAASMSPAELQTHVPNLLSKFPEVALPLQQGAAVDNETMMGIFLEKARKDAGISGAESLPLGAGKYGAAFKENEAVREASKKFAEYNRLRLDTVSRTAPLTQNGFQAPKSMQISLGVQPTIAGFNYGGTVTKVKNLTDPNEVEWVYRLQMQKGK